MLLNNYNNIELLCGADEAGAGCLAGPVVAAAVILPKDFLCDGLRDSKKMSLKKRNLANTYIREHALSFSISEVDNIIIDKINILQSRYLAMDKSIKKIDKIDYLLIDGNSFYKEYGVPFSTIIKGDDKYSCIAAASVLAKVYRDKLMVELHEQYPQYNWLNNKGYGTAQHIEAIKKYGLTPYHRLTFVKNFLQ